MSGAAGGAGRGSGGAAGVADSGSTASGGASTDGSADTRGAGGTAGSGGAAGSMSTTDAGGRSGGPPADASVLDASVLDASVLDATSDRTVTDDVGSHDAADGDARADAATDAPPPRDAGGGGCIPNEVRSIATCGNCGLFLQVCNAQRVWDPPFCRQEPGACAPGSTERRMCPSGGTQVATCTASCTWSLGDCVLPPPCTVGQTEVVPCSLCGTQKRTCLATEGGIAWGPFLACTNQGACAPGTRDKQACGNKCGTRTRFCTPTCSWDKWGECEGEGECRAGTTETRSCVIIPIVLNGKQTRSCEASCAWGPWSVCK